MPMSQHVRGWAALKAVAASDLSAGGPARDRTEVCASFHAKISTASGGVGEGTQTQQRQQLPPQAASSGSRSRQAAEAGHITPHGNPKHSLCEQQSVNTTPNNSKSHRCGHSDTPNM